VTTLRALTLTALLGTILWVCAVTDQVPDVVGIVLALGVLVFAHRTPLIDERMGR
jgi:hypothetical protein